MRYVLLAGGAAVGGWLLLVAYAFFYGEPTVTHSFVDYATSYEVLLGAEIDKLIPVMMVMLILAVVLRRARRMLVSAVAEQHCVPGASSRVGVLRWISRCWAEDPAGATSALEVTTA